jgi:hypothetical protein
MDIKIRRNFPDGLPFRNKTLWQFTLIQASFRGRPNWTPRFLAGSIAIAIGNLLLKTPPSSEPGCRCHMKKVFLRLHVAV